jgi:hypothetical protein
MLLDFLWLMVVSAALVVFFVFYLAFAYLLFSPLFDHLIEQAFPRGILAVWPWKASSRSGSARVTSAPARGHG